MLNIQILAINLIETLIHNSAVGVSVAFDDFYQPF
jgi:hypothetical protein